MLIWLTAYLANKAGWKENYIHTMPFYKVLLYLHAYNVLDGANTQWLKASADAVELNLDSLNELIEDL